MLGRRFTADFWRSIDQTVLPIERSVAVPVRLNRRQPFWATWKHLAKFSEGKEGLNIHDDLGRAQRTAAENRVSPTNVYWSLNLRALCQQITAIGLVFSLKLKEI